MTLVMNSPAKNGGLTKEKNTSSASSQDELIIRIESTREQKSPMPEELKKKRRANSPELNELFEETLKQKNEYSSSETKWINDNEVQVNGMSDMTLHSFILKAEELGKKITYTKTLKVSISD